MNYLLDTHTLIWAITDKQKLSTRALQTIENTNNEIFVSAISFWEVALKFSLSKLNIHGFSPEELPGLAQRSGFTIISLLSSDASTYHQLQPVGSHKDPFDKMLLWQAIQQDLILISKDRDITGYASVGLKVLW